MTHSGTQGHLLTGQERFPEKPRVPDGALRVRGHCEQDGPSTAAASPGSSPEPRHQEPVPSRPQDAGAVLSLLSHGETEARTECLGITEGAYNHCCTTTRTEGSSCRSPLSPAPLVPRGVPGKSLCPPFLGPFPPPLWGHGCPGTPCCPGVCAARGLGVVMLLSPYMCVPRPGEVCHSTAVGCPQPGSSHPRGAPPSLP